MVNIPPVYSQPSGSRMPPVGRVGECGWQTTCQMVSWVDIPPTSCKEKLFPVSVYRIGGKNSFKIQYDPKIGISIFKRL